MDGVMPLPVLVPLFRRKRLGALLNLGLFLLLGRFDKRLHRFEEELRLTKFVSVRIQKASEGACARKIVFSEPV
jgi:hypothetical protein